MTDTFITLPEHLPPQCLAFADAMCESLNKGKGRSIYSRAYAMNGMESEPFKQAQAKLGECALAIYLDIDPQTLDWTDQPDLGADMKKGGRRIDCKSSGPRSRCLIWPISKNSIFAAKRFDDLVFVRGEFRAWEIVGWLLKSEFFKQKQIAPQGHFLKEGTWFMEDKFLRSPQTLRALVNEKPASNPGSIGPTELLTG